MDVAGFFLTFYYSYPLNVAAFLIIGFIFLRMLIIQIFFDVRDIRGDKRIGLLTIPVVFGRDRTVKFLKTANILVLILLAPVVFYCQLKHSFSFLLVFFLVIPFSFYYLGKIYCLEKRDYPYLLAASEPIFWLVLVLFSKFLLWIVLI